MELKMKYQYTNFVYPYAINTKLYDKYIMKLLKNPKLKVKFFDREKDKNIYDYFLPNIREKMFYNFYYDNKKILEFSKLDKRIQATILSKYSCVFFEYKIKDTIQGKVGDENGIFFKIDSIELICFNTGICFEVVKTHIENSNKWEDVLNFNYKFKNLIQHKNDLENKDKIKIQADSFSNMEDVRNLITSIIGKKVENINERIYTYAYTCIEQEAWNENQKIDDIKNEIDKYVNINYSNSNVRLEETNIYNISKLKFAKVGITSRSTALITSGIDVYNYTKLPYIYENEYFYTYILQLYKKIYLKKIEIDCRKNKSEALRRRFFYFSKNIWAQEITDDICGNEIKEKWEEQLELNKDYKNIKNKYDLMYKESKIEKNEKINKIIIFILIISLLLNIINFFILLK